MTTSSVEIWIALCGLKGNLGKSSYRNWESSYVSGLFIRWVLINQLLGHPDFFSSHPAFQLQYLQPAGNIPVNTILNLNIGPTILLRWPNHLVTGSWPAHKLAVFGFCLFWSSVHHWFSLSQDDSTSQFAQPNCCPRTIMLIVI